MLRGAFPLLGMPRSHHVCRTLFPDQICTCAGDFGSPVYKLARLSITPKSEDDDEQGQGLPLVPDERWGAGDDTTAMAATAAAMNAAVHEDEAEVVVPPSPSPRRLGRLASSRICSDFDWPPDCSPRVGPRAQNPVESPLSVRARAKVEELLAGALSSLPAARRPPLPRASHAIQAASAPPGMWSMGGIRARRRELLLSHRTA